VLTQNPSDKTAQLYLDRTTWFKEHGVPSNWVGIEILTKK